MAFVQARGTHFTLDGASFYFAGCNTYYLMYKSQGMVDAVLDSAQELGLRAVRTWAFLDMGSLDGSMPSVSPPGPKEGVYFQYWNPAIGGTSFNDGPTGLERLDYVVFAASRRGLKLILPLVNNWPDFGGIDQYAAWFSLPAHNDFYTDGRARQAYKDWVSHLLNRVNTLTGVRYRDDTTIMAWELGNETRSIDAPANLLNWIGELSQFVKQTDPNHLVGIGDDGFLRRAQSPDWTYNGSQGTDFEAFLGVPTVDFGTFHLYPDRWGESNDFGLYWIDDHIGSGSRAGKPVVLEEYGLQDQASRNEVFQSWLDEFQA